MRAAWRCQGAWRACSSHWRAGAAGTVGGAVGLTLFGGPPLLAEESPRSGSSRRREVFVWGRCQGIPGGAERDVLVPRRVEWFGTHAAGWDKISFGPNFGAALDGNGVLFVWGEGAEDGLPIGPLLANVQGDGKGKRFKDVQCSSTKLWALTEQGHTFVFDDILIALQERSLAASAAAEAASAAADPAASSRDPLPIDARTVPGLPQPGRFSWLLGGDGVKQMGVGLEHGAFVTQRGQLFCVGGNEWGQCGVAPPRQKGPMGAMEERTRVEVETPSLVQFPAIAKPITYVAVGGRHTIAVDTSGQSFAFGDDRRIQLGLGDTRSAGSDERHSYGVLHQDAQGGLKTKADIKRAVIYRYYDPHMQWSAVETVPPVVYNRPPYPKASFLTCGEDFTIAIHRDSPDWFAAADETNLVMCCGENGTGQCGRTLAQQQQPWLAARLPKRSKTLLVSCGQSHTLALLSTGEVFGWGSSDQGQVGNGKRALVGKPVRVCVEEEAEAAKPKVGDSDEKRAPPREVVKLPGKITGISCGFRNSAVIVEPARELTAST